MSTARTDWPIGPALKRARIAAGLSVKAAARRTKGSVSDGRWYQLESGYQLMRGERIPISTRPETIVAAARAVNWDPTEALHVAGFDPADYQPGITRGKLDEIPTNELIAELHRRLGRAAERLGGIPDEAQPWFSGPGWRAAGEVAVERGSQDPEERRQFGES